MTRTVDLAHRAEVLDRIVAFVMEHGLADLALRPLAAAVGLSPRTLLYHFGSRDDLIVAVLGRIREGQRAAFAALRSEAASSSVGLCRAAWRAMSSSSDGAAIVRLFFETFALALGDPVRYASFLHDTIEDWLAFLTAPLLARGMQRDAARAHATAVLAGYRGFMLDFAATGDRARIERAIDRWADALHRCELENGESESC